MKKRFLIPIITIIIVLAACAGCYYMTMPMQGQSEEIAFKIEKDEYPRDTIKKLKEKGLIRNEYFTLLYVKMNNKANFKAGDYDLNKSDSLREIIDTLNDSTAAIDKDSKKMTFTEGSSLEDIASKIAQVYGLNKDDVIAKLDDKTFVQTLIDDKDIEIVTNSVLKEGIRHPLEGYLYADTYYFKKDATVEEIAKKLVSTMNTKYKEAGKKVNYSEPYYHDVIALASMVELEGPSRNSSKYEDELQGVAEVFLNRTYVGMTLGSDVTTYYSVRKRIGTDSLTVSDFKVCDGYNTRGSCVPGIPVGAICSPSYDAILAVMKGLKTPKYPEYYYFVADKNTNIHFSKSDADQQKVIKELRNQGLWLED